MEGSRLVGTGAACIAMIGAFMAGAAFSPFASIEEAPAARSALALHAETGGGGAARDTAWIEGEDGQVARADSASERLDVAEIRALEASARIGGEVAAAHASETPTSVPISSAAISGIVRDIAGKPIEGVLLRARPSNDQFWRDRQLEDMALWPQDGSAPDLDVQRALRTTAMQFARIDGRAREIISDAEGRFRFEQLTSEAWRVEAYAKGWKLRSTLAEDGRTWPGQKLDFVGQQLVRVTLAVVNSADAPATRACIDVEVQNQNQEQRLWMATAPHLWLAPGTYRLRAREKPGQSPVSEPVALAVDPGVEPAPVKLVLREEARVVGTLRGEAVTRFGSRAISLEFTEPTPMPEMNYEYYEQFNGFGGRRSRNVEMEEKNGELQYRTTGLNPGKYKLRARLSRALVLHERDVELARGETRIDLDLALEAGSRVVDASVLDSAGQAQLDATLRVQVRAPNRGPNESVAAIAAGEGRWWLVHSAKVLEKAGEATFQAFAQSPRLGSLQTTYKPQYDSQVELRFLEPAHLIVRLGAPSPKGLMVQIALQAERKEGEGDPREEEPSAMLGDATEVALGPLKPGRYKLIARASQRDWEFYPLVEEAIDLRPGRQERSLALPEMHSLGVRVTDAQPGQVHRGRVWRADDPSSSFRTNFTVQNGKGELTGLPTGRYEAELQEGGPGGARRESFSVPGSSELVFGPANPASAPRIALRVEIQDPAGRAAKAGLQQSDWIVGIGGKRFEKMEEVQPRFTGAPYYLNGGTIPLDVERSGSVIRIDLETEVLLNPGGSGARFRPPGR